MTVDKAPRDEGDKNPNTAKANISKLKKKKSV